MATRDEIMAALDEVMDPELHRSLVELNMIRDVTVEDSTVKVVVALTVPGCPMKKQIHQSVEERLLMVPGVEQVQVEMTSMSEDERKKLFGQNNEEIPLLASGAKIVAVASGKGGVGKSTVTANLAVGLGQLGYRVGVIDADIYGFSMGRMLNLTGEAMLTEDEKIIPFESHGIKAISMGAMMDEETPLVWRGPLLRSALQQFLADVLWGQLDFMIIDLPPGTGDVAIDLAQMIPESYLLIVTTPQRLATGVASRAAHLADKVGQKVIGVVENMSYFVAPDTGKRYEIFGSGGGRQLADKLGVPLLGQIPLTPTVRETGDEGNPVVLEQDNPAGKALREVVKRVVELTRTRP
ncbi:MAG: Mrp/NBP35 family ATP-binding protein [Bacillota bacterium]